LCDEVDTIHLEVEELQSRPVSPAPSSLVSILSDAASSPDPPRQVPDLNSPLESPEGEQDKQDPPIMYPSYVLHYILISGHLL